MALLEPQFCKELLRSDGQKRAKFPHNFLIERPPWHTSHSHSFGHVTWKLWVGLPVPSLFHGLKLAHSSVLKRAEARLGAIRIIFHRSACPSNLSDIQWKDIALLMWWRVFEVCSLNSYLTGWGWKPLLRSSSMSKTLPKPKCIVIIKKWLKIGVRTIGVWLSQSYAQQQH